MNEFLDSIKAAGINCSDPMYEDESQEYSACHFRVNERQVDYRAAKITQKKNGQFVTFWKRLNAIGKIMPFDDFDLLVVAVREQERVCHFIFPKTLFSEKGIISLDGVGGKRGFRVYPKWDKSVNRQAQITQKWQLECFYVDLLRFWNYF